MAIITIARHFGAGGRTLGEMVANKLGFDFYDNEVIQKVSTQAKVSVDTVDEMEKDADGMFKKFFSDIVPKSFKDLMISRKQDYIDEEIYVDILKRIINEIADNGDAVIIGRGSQYILEDRNDVFHLLIIADEQDRIHFLEDKYELTHSQAVRAVTQDDKRRANLYQKFGKTGYDQPDQYHLVLNTTKLDFETARDLAVGLVQSDKE
jgi:cytidylate kinase